jgi:hypothetical protein
MSKERERNSSDLRSPITISLLCRLVSLLSNVCSSDYEASMFSAAFALGLMVFCGLGALLLKHAKRSWFEVRRLQHHQQIKAHGQHMVNKT